MSRCRAGPGGGCTGREAGGAVIHSSYHPFVHSFDKHVLSTCCVLGHLGALDTRVTEVAPLL